MAPSAHLSRRTSAEPRELRASIRPTLLRPALGGTATTIGLGKAEQTRSRGSATPARPGLSQLHFHATGRFRLPVGCRFDLGLALYPRGALAAGAGLRALRVDPARGLVRAGLQLI